MNPLVWGSIPVPCPWARRSGDHNQNVPICLGAPHWSLSMDPEGVVTPVPETEPLFSQFTNIERRDGK